MILKDLRVVRPKTTKIQKDKKSGINYVYQVVESKYDSKKKYNIDTRKIIGRMVDDTYMIPNNSFEKYYPYLLLKEEPQSDFSDTIHVGAVCLLTSLLNKTEITSHLKEIFPQRYKLIEDLIMYMIIEESCAYQHFSYFEREVPTLTRSVYSDSTVSRLLENEISAKDINAFLDEWNKTNSNISDVYLDYDSTNIPVRGNLDGLGEYGYSKDDETLPQINISYVVAKENNRPLSYALYPGSIHDASEVEMTLNKFSKYNYKNIGFIFDRAYYSKELVKELKKKNYAYIMMLKENLDFVVKQIDKHYVTLTNQVTCYIEDYAVSGVKERINLQEESNKKPLMVYVYTFYNSQDATIDKLKLLTTISQYEKEIEHIKATNKLATKENFKRYEKYFSFRYNKLGYLLNYKKKEKAIQKILNHFGFFALLSEKEMTPRDALITYRERDAIEKLFRALKDSMDFNHIGVYTKASLEAKVFLTFVATIIRNEVFQKTKQLKLNERKNLIVSVLLKELSNIEATINNQNIYSRRYALTAKQKKILGLYNINSTDIDNTIKNFNDDLSNKQDKNS